MTDEEAILRRWCKSRRNGATAFPSFFLGLAHFSLAFLEKVGLKRRALDPVIEREQSLGKLVKRSFV